MACSSSRLCRITVAACLRSVMSMTAARQSIPSPLRYRPAMPSTSTWNGFTSISNLISQVCLVLASITFLQKSAKIGRSSKATNCPNRFLIAVLRSSPSKMAPARLSSRIFPCSSHKKYPVGAKSKRSAYLFDASCAVAWESSSSSFCISSSIWCTCSSCSNARVSFSAGILPCLAFVLPKCCSALRRSSAAWGDSPAFSSFACMASPWITYLFASIRSRLQWQAGLKAYPKSPPLAWAYGSEPDDPFRLRGNRPSS